MRTLVWQSVTRDGVYTAISNDAIGNPLSDGTRTYTWRNGRELATLTKDNVTWSYTYNADGMRTKRTNGTTTYRYFYAGSQLTQFMIDDYNIKICYDEKGLPMVMLSNDGCFYYMTNIQGDVIGLIDSGGELVVQYEYDPWGSIVSITGSMASTVGMKNPLRYRGYVYDDETGLYYLQSRYYNPDLRRFINADALTSTGQGFIGYNMFAYCNNNPVNMKDYSGTKPGDLFDTMDEAAIDFAICYNAQSIEDMQEYGSAIYEVKTTVKQKVTVTKTHKFLFWTWTTTSTKTVKTTKIQYSYTKPAIGIKGNTVIPNLFTLNPIVSTVHTHANHDPKYDNENFSKGTLSDIWWANIFHMDIYLATPGGYLKKYTYSNRNDRNGGVTVISRDIPWDVNSPLR